MGTACMIRRARTFRNSHDNQWVVCLAGKRPGHARRPARGLHCMYVRTVPSMYACMYGVGTALDFAVCTVPLDAEEEGRQPTRRSADAGAGAGAGAEQMQDAGLAAV